MILVVVGQVLVAADAGALEEVFDYAFGCFAGWRKPRGGQLRYRIKILCMLVGALPGVFNSLLCGMWNCIVLGGDWPNGRPPPEEEEEKSSSSSSLSHIPALPAFAPVGFKAARGFPGVSTLTPGVRGLRTGEEKISACS